MQLKTRGKFALSVLLLCFYQTSVFAEQESGEHSAGFDRSEKRTHEQFILGMQASQVAIASKDLIGAGIRFGYEYGISKNWSILPAVALVFSLGGTQGYLYSSIEGSFRYSLIGSLGQSSSEISFRQRPVVTVDQRRENRLALTAGFEQLFLNGAQTIYPAAGISFGAAYSCPVFQHWVEFALRDSIMSAGTRQATVIFVDISLLFGGL